MGYSHSHDNNDKTQMFGIAALAAGVGALTAILFTNRSGPETRQALRDKIAELKTKPTTIKDEISEAADNAAVVADQAKQTAVDKAKIGADKVKEKADSVDK